MTEVEWVNHWEGLYEGIFIVGPPKERARKKPNDQHLDRLEEVLQIRLPSSYRAFVKVFGPGYLARSFPIFAPGYRGAGVVDFLANNKWQGFEAEGRPEPERIKRAVAFSECAYELIVWDTCDVTDPSGPEYRVLRLPRSKSDGLLPVTDSFHSFIERYCLEGQYTEMLGGTFESTWQEEDTGEVKSIRCFDPVGGEPRSSV